MYDLLKEDGASALCEFHAHKSSLVRPAQLVMQGVPFSASRFIKLHLCFWWLICHDGLLI